jgi:hypothetical protein
MSAHKKSKKIEIFVDIIADGKRSYLKPIICSLLPPKDHTLNLSFMCSK